MSSGRGGRPWRRIRAQVLTRDNHRCRIRGPRCTGYADTVDHVTPLAYGGAPFDPSNLRAACARCNYGNGARIVNAKRRAGTAKRNWPPRRRATIKPLPL